MPTHEPTYVCDTATGPDEQIGLTVTWTVTHTYTAILPFDLVTAAAGRQADVVRVDPFTLCGAVPKRLADLLHERQDDARLSSSLPEVEIIDAHLDEQPALAELFAEARNAVHVESGSGEHTNAGRALAALLAGLAREGHALP
jgi:hypothetical protein